VHFGNVKVRNVLPEEARTALYRVVQEALTNVERHAQATEVSVNFKIQGEWFGVTVTDNGVGFDAERGRGARNQRGIGLRNISERLSYLRARRFLPVCRKRCCGDHLRSSSRRERDDPCPAGR